ncbi:hypothetical protein ACXAUS_003892 [Clostridium sporogenes]
MLSVQELIDKANTVTYTKPIKVHSKATYNKDIPKEHLNDCLRIVEIFKDKADINISLGLAYDLWHTHSKESFYGSFECMDGVSDNVIYNNLINIINCFEFID